MQELLEMIIKMRCNLDDDETTIMQMMREKQLRSGRGSNEYWSLFFASVSCMQSIARHEEKARWIN